jgi:hypothetical protein
MAIRYEYRTYGTGGFDGAIYAVAIDDSAEVSPPAGYFDQQIAGIPASIPPVVIQAAIEQSDTIVITPQVLVEGFGSYLADILPPDIAVTAGAFGASMQQIKNITQIPVEKFAQVVASTETIQGLDLVNGTNVPVDIPEAQAAYELVALGTGPYKTFTYSDFYGCMSGLPYDWPQLQLLLNDLQTSNLTNIYQNLYNAIIAGPQPYDPFTNPTPIPTYNATVQTQIDLANAEIALIRTVRPGASVDLNNLYDTFATQLGNEQRARNTGLSPVADPRDPYINKYPITIYSFVDLLPLYGKQTQPHMATQTLEAISDLTFVAGQSIIAAMREARNQDRLSYVGVTLDNNIPDVIEDQEEWIADGVLANSVPSFPTSVVPLGYWDPVKKAYFVYTAATTTSTIIGNGAIGNGAIGNGTVPYVVNTFDANGNPVTSIYGTGRPARPVDTGGPRVPGSLAKSPYQKLIPPQLNTLFTSDVLLPAQYSVEEAIEQVIDCNCDCWLQ